MEVGSAARRLFACRAGAKGGGAAHFPRAGGKRCTVGIDRFGSRHFPRANSNRARRSSGPALSPAAGEYCARQQGRTRAALPSTACGSRFLLARSGTLRTLRQSGGPLLCPGSACTRFRLLPGLRRFSGKRMQAQLARRPAPAGEADGNGRLLGGTESVIPFSSRIAPKKGEAGCLTPFCSILTAR